MSAAKPVAYIQNGFGGWSMLGWKPVPKHLPWGTYRAYLDTPQNIKYEILNPQTGSWESVGERMYEACKNQVYAARKIIVIEYVSPL